MACRYASNNQLLIHHSFSTFALSLYLYTQIFQNQRLARPHLAPDNELVSVKTFYFFTSLTSALHTCVKRMLLPKIVISFNYLEVTHQPYPEN